MNKTYRVKFIKKHDRWYAIDDNGSWRAYGEASRCIAQEGFDLVRSIFHAEEIDSVSVDQFGTTTARIKEYS
jgi:hypothetical protein